jgi:hypothetical protein
MKKNLYILYTTGILLFSCTGTDEMEIQNGKNLSVDIQPEKISVQYAALPKITSLDPALNYEFSYENGYLRKMSGKVIFTGGFELFFKNESSVLSYNNNQVTIEHSETADNGAKNIVYTMENNKPKKAELYDAYSFLFSKKEYFYETNKIITYEKTYTWEYYTTYFFDSSKNLIKAEKLEKSAGIDKKLTTTFYLNFDKAKNPYKKLYLLNDNFYEKSLSENNFRKITYTIQDLQNTQYPPGYGNAEWSYNYNSSGQVILHFQ